MQGEEEVFLIKNEVKGSELLSNRNSFLVIFSISKWGGGQLLF